MTTTLDSFSFLKLYFILFWWECGISLLKKKFSYTYSITDFTTSHPF